VAYLGGPPPALERAAAALALLLALGARPETVAAFAAASPEAAGLDAGILGQALLLRRWLGEPPGFGPLPPKAQAALRAQLQNVADPQHRRALAEELARAAPAPGAIGSAAPAVAAVLARWIEGILATA
jgi:hypothetical protein